MRCPAPLAPGGPPTGVVAAQLTPAELAARLDRVLFAAGRLVARIPDDRIDWTPPRLGASLRDLGFHVFRIALAFADGMDMGRVRPEWLQEGAPADLRDGASVARYGALVQGRLSGWFEGAGAGEYGRVIDVAGEACSGHALLAATARHVAHHVRQLHVVLGELDAGPLEPLPSAEVDGLGLPAGLW